MVKQPRVADDIMVSQAEEDDHSCSQPIKHCKLASSRQSDNNRSTRLKKLEEKEREHMNTQELLSVRESFETGKSSMLDSVKAAACGYYKWKSVLTMRTIYQYDDPSQD